MRDNGVITVGSTEKKKELLPVLKKKKENSYLYQTVEVEFG